eukprot:g76168.t1
MSAPLTHSSSSLSISHSSCLQMAETSTVWILHLCLVGWSLLLFILSLIQVYVARQAGMRNRMQQMAPMALLVNLLHLVRCVDPYGLVGIYTEPVLLYLDSTTVGLFQLDIMLLAMIHVEAIAFLPGASDTVRQRSQLLATFFRRTWKRWCAGVLLWTQMWAIFRAITCKTWGQGLYTVTWVETADVVEDVLFSAVLSVFFFGSLHFLEKDIRGVLASIPDSPLSKSLLRLQASRYIALTVYLLCNVLWVLQLVSFNMQPHYYFIDKMLITPFMICAVGSIYLVFIWQQRTQVSKSQRSSAATDASPRFSHQSHLSVDASPRFSGSVSNNNISLQLPQPSGSASKWSSLFFLQRPSDSE